MDMATSQRGAASQRFMIQYRNEDFPLYLLSLLIPGILIAPALPHPAAQAALLCALLYLAVVFAIRHGATFDARVLRVVVDGIASYPAILARGWRTARHVVIPVAIIFALALGAEQFLRPRLAGTTWLRPFPWQWALWAPFLLLTLFRVVILVAHLLRASVVRDVLTSSPQRKSIEVLSIHQHIVHAFVTGMVAHLSLVAPCALFFMLTEPTILREGLLVVGYTAWTGIARPLRKRKLLGHPGVIANRLVYQNHNIAHQSRFYFTVFHGHHHDAIPSALIGSAAGTGFLENADRAMTTLEPLKSLLIVQATWAWVIAFDMVVHQYIPGVFPFAKPTITGVSHHVTHHFGRALPLGIIFSGYVEPGDMNNGYKPDNSVTRWFLKQVEQREGIDPELGRKFLTLNDYGKPKAPKAPKTGKDARAV
jgi:hypothetical protein